MAAKHLEIQLNETKIQLANAMARLEPRWISEDDRDWLAALFRSKYFSGIRFRLVMPAEEVDPEAFDFGRQLLEAMNEGGIIPDVQYEQFPNIDPLQIKFVLRGPRIFDLPPAISNLESGFKAVKIDCADAGSIAWWIDKPGGVGRESDANDIDIVVGKHNSGMAEFRNEVENNLQNRAADKSVSSEMGSNELNKPIKKCDEHPWVPTKTFPLALNRTASPASST